jgi:hypothetical protein
LSIQSYPPVAIAILFYLEFTWGGPPPPLSGGACHTLATVGCLLLSKHTRGGGSTPAFSGRLVYLQFTWGSASPSPLSGGAFLMTGTITSFPCSKVAGQGPLLLPSPVCLFTVHSLELRAPCSLCYMSIFFSAACLLFSFFSFFLGRGSVCPESYADLSQGVPCAAYLLT